MESFKNNKNYFFLGYKGSDFSEYDELKKLIYNPYIPKIMKIEFYKTKEPYGEFSNFSKHPIVMKGKVWPTTEHYFQAQKFAGTEHEENIRLTSGPRAAAEMGRDRNLPLRSDWELVKESIMKDALLAKINQYPKIKELLLSTGDAEIVEHSVNDKYWADGGDGSGKNRLGVVWMEIREELKKQIPKTRFADMPSDWKPNPGVQYNC